jgi:hypothetical protein
MNILTIRDVADDYRKYFEETWPKALSKLKEIAEVPSVKRQFHA